MSLWAALEPLSQNKVRKRIGPKIVYAYMQEGNPLTSPNNHSSFCLFTLPAQRPVANTSTIRKIMSEMDNYQVVGVCTGSCCERSVSMTKAWVYTTVGHWQLHIMWSVGLFFFWTAVKLQTIKCCNIVSEALRFMEGAGDLTFGSWNNLVLALEYTDKGCIIVF